MTSTVRVFQVATGNVGSEMIKRIGNRDDLELVGLHCYTADKIGRDAGELVGLPPIGVKATGTVEEIIAAKPDVLTFHGVFPDEDLYVKVLEAGINIVTTADWITGWHRDANHPHPSGQPVTQLLAEAAAKGGSSFYGTGMNPGLNQILGVVVRPTSPRSRTSPPSSRSTCRVTTARTPGWRSATGCPWRTRRFRRSWRSTPGCSPTACC
jgi:4-hydroxy-tetrahydrodipicolinate reductase